MLRRAGLRARACPSRSLSLPHYGDCVAAADPMSCMACPMSEAPKCGAAEVALSFIRFNWRSPPAIPQPTPSSKASGLLRSMPHAARRCAPPEYRSADEAERCLCLAGYTDDGRCQALDTDQRETGSSNSPACDLWPSGRGHSGRSRVTHIHHRRRAKSTYVEKLCSLASYMSYRSNETRTDRFRFRQGHGPGR